MTKKLITATILTVILVLVISLSFEVKKVQASGIITIRPDGSIDPSTGSIVRLDNVTYLFTGNINSSIVVQRNNIVVDGAGFALQGDGSSNGFSLSGVTNVTVTDVEVSGFVNGFNLSYSSGNTISRCRIRNNSLYGIQLNTYSSSNSVYENNITANGQDAIFVNLYSSYNLISRNIMTENFNASILFSYSSSNIVVGNDIENNSNGMWTAWSSGNQIYHNNFVNNTHQAQSAGSSNFWNSSYPSGGNYWSDYNGSDGNADAIGDTPYSIPGAQVDGYPLMGRFSTFNTSAGIFVDVVSNFTVRDFDYFSGNSSITMHVLNPSLYQDAGFSRVTVSKSLISPPYKVTIDGGFEKLIYLNDELFDDIASRWIYFSYQYSAGEVVIQSGWNPPTIAVLSPQNKTYSTSSVPLEFTVDQMPSWMGYNLDSQANVTITGNGTLSGLSDGEHNVIVYASNLVGIMNSSSGIYFTVDTTPPLVTNVSQSPAADNVKPDEQVMVSATVTDTLSGVKQVYLNYTVGNGTWIVSNMLNVEGSVWNGTIPGFPYGTNVTYVVVAEDNAGNVATAPAVGFEYYAVLPESFSLIALSLLALTASVVIVLAKRRRFL